MTRTQRISATVFFLLIAVLAFFWAMQVDPGFFARNLLAALYGDLQNHSLNIPFRGNVPGQKPFLAILHLITGIPVGDLAYLPLGAFLRATFYFAIVHSLTRNKVAASTLALMTTVYPWAGWGYSSVFVHSLGAPLFFAATLVCLIGMRKRVNQKHIMLLILLLLSLHLFDYTAEVWLIVMLLLLALFGIIGRFQARSSEIVRPSSFAILVVLGGIFFWTKNTSLTYIGKITQLNPFTALSGYFGPTAANAQFPYEYERATSGLGLSTYFYLLTVVPIAIYGVTIAYQTVRRRSFDFSDEEYIIGAMILGGSGATILYLFMGRFTQYFVFVGVPLVALVSIHFFGERVSLLPVKTSTVITVFAVALLVLAGAETVVLVSNDNFSRGSSAAIEPGGEWLFSHSEQPTVLAGISSRGLMRLPEVRNGANANWSVYRPRSYSHLVEGDSMSAEFVAVDFATKWGTRSIGGWKVFESLRKYRSEVETNTHLNAVYSSGDFVIYHSNNE